MSAEFDGIQLCEKCGEYALGRLCLSCARQMMIDNAVPEDFCGEGDLEDEDDYDDDYDEEQSSLAMLITRIKRLMRRWRLRLRRVRTFILTGHDISDDLPF